MSKKTWLTLSSILLFFFSQSSDSFPNHQYEYKKPFFIQGLNINSISFSPEIPKQGDRIQIIVEVENTSTSTAYNKINLEVIQNYKVIGNSYIPVLKPKEKTKATISYALPESLTGKVTFEIILSPPKGPKKSASINVASKVVPAAPIIAEPIYKPTPKPVELPKPTPKSVELPKPIPKPGIKDMPEIEWPDLAILELTLTPPQPQEGDELSFRYRIKNKGNCIASNFHVSVYKDGREAYRDYFASLDFGQEAIRENKWIALPQGNHTLRIKADSDGVVAESDDNNNLMEKTFTASKVILISQFWANPLQVNLGENVMLGWRLLSEATQFSLGVTYCPFTGSPQFQSLITDKPVTLSEESAIDTVTLGELPYGGSAEYLLTASKPTGTVGKIYDRREVTVQVKNLLVGSWSGTYYTAGEDSPPEKEEFILNSDGSGWWNRWLDKKNEWSKSQGTWVQTSSNQFDFNFGNYITTFYDMVVSTSTLSFKINVDVYSMETNERVGTAVHVYNLQRK